MDIGSARNNLTNILGLLSLVSLGLSVKNLFHRSRHNRHRKQRRMEQALLPVVWSELEDVFRKHLVIHGSRDGVVEGLREAKVELEKLGYIAENRDTKHQIMVSLTPMGQEYYENTKESQQIAELGIFGQQLLLYIGEAYGQMDA